MSYRLVQSPVAIIEQFWRIESKCCYLQQIVEPNSQKKSWKKDKDPVEHKYSWMSAILYEEITWMAIIGEIIITVHTRK